MIASDTPQRTFMPTNFAVVPALGATTTELDTFVLSTLKASDVKSASLVSAMDKI